LFTSFWAAEAVEWCYYDIMEDIESTRTKYPEEEELEAEQDRQRQEQEGTLIDTQA